MNGASNSHILTSISMNSKLMNSNEVTVSIRCTVFNHGPYLRQCLDGFVKQKTNFKFEAFVHDDASTDDSAAIILEYARMYPDIIVPCTRREVVNFVLSHTALNIYEANT